MIEMGIVLPIARPCCTAMRVHTQFHKCACHLEPYGCLISHVTARVQPFMRVHNCCNAQPLLGCLCCCKSHLFGWVGLGVATLVVCVCVLTAVVAQHTYITHTNTDCSHAMSNQVVCDSHVGLVPHCPKTPGGVYDCCQLGTLTMHMFASCWLKT